MSDFKRPVRSALKRRGSGTESEMTLPFVAVASCESAQDADNEFAKRQKHCRDGYQETLSDPRVTTNPVAIQTLERKSIASPADRKSITSPADTSACDELEIGQQIQTSGEANVLKSESEATLGLGEAKTADGDGFDKLIEWLRSVGCEEKPETLKQHHERVLFILRQVVDRCVELQLENYGLTSEMIAQSAVHMRTFGSYRMGVDSAGSDNDIDVLFIGGRYVDRAGFFLRLQSAFERDSRVTSVKVFLAQTNTSRRETTLYTHTHTHFLWQHRTSNHAHLSLGNYAPFFFLAAMDITHTCIHTDSVCFEFNVGGSTCRTRMYHSSRSTFWERMLTYSTLSWLRRLAYYTVTFSFLSQHVF
jgi:hypothetical protein